MNTRFDVTEFRWKLLEEFPDFRLEQKNESRLMRFLNVLLLIVTFGQMRTFMTKFVTTVGCVMYVPANWATLPPSSQLAVLRHERIHMLQQQRYGRLLFSFLYLFFPLPLGLAYFRKKFEMEAYAESMRAHFGSGGSLSNLSYREAIIRHFTSAEYGWMWPFRRSVERWFDKTTHAILEYEANRTTPIL